MSRPLLATACSVGWILVGCGAPTTPPSTPPVSHSDPSPPIRAIVQAQSDAWNRGDIDAFMQGYWKSPELTFSSGGKTTRGWQSTLAGYRERYPTPARMGQLQFEHLEITPLNASAALVLGTWTLRRDADPLTGNFSLVFRKIDGQWRIIHDHTSLADDR